MSNFATFVTPKTEKIKDLLSSEKYAQANRNDISVFMMSGRVQTQFDNDRWDLVVRALSEADARAIWDDYFSDRPFPKGPRLGRCLNLSAIEGSGAIFPPDLYTL